MIRVLFVVDDADPLNGTRQTLGEVRPEWTVHLAADARAALGRLDAALYDVVVCDMSLTGMGGSALLGRIKDQHPATVRVALSGRAGPEEFLKVVGPAHQYLAKPCDTGDLITTIERSVALRRTLANDQLLQVVSRIESLPTLPQLYAEMQKALNGPDSSLSRVAAILEQDPAMSTNVLKLVNSAFFGQRRQVRDIGHALNLLGTDHIAALVLARGFFRQFDSYSARALEVSHIWERSLMAGQIAATLARADGAGRSMEEHAATAGLLHDVGILVLATTFPRYVELAPRLAATDARRSELETEHIGASHAEVGAYLLGIWGLPDTIVSAVAYHESPALETHSTLGVLTYVHVASVITEFGFQLSPESPEWDMLPFDYEYLASVNRLGELSTWLDAVRTRMQETQPS